MYSPEIALSSSICCAIISASSAVAIWCSRRGGILKEENMKGNK
ncbi:hypothetical protein HanLR1_Chr10g0347751 [Helianthus annuus]|nr:hypothetical protein HanLR1_Chr10g0347751 [Helianthus annuus]